MTTAYLETARDGELDPETPIFNDLLIAPTAESDTEEVAE